MNPNRPAAPPEAPLMPPASTRETGWARWISVVVALLILAGVGWRGYEWLAGYVAQRDAGAQVQLEPPVAAADPGLAPAPAATGVGASSEPLAPAVTGEAIHRCMHPDGRLVLTNQACPAGTTAEASNPARAGLPPQSVSWNADDPSERDATCHFLTAEIARLSYEFQQPLPPPVLDLISTRLSGLRGQSEQGRCGPPSTRDNEAGPAREKRPPKAAEAKNTR